jgi:hypothetical protein
VRDDGEGAAARGFSGDVVHGGAVRQPCRSGRRKKMDGGDGPG